MGSQYIRGTTYSKTRHKKNKGGIPNRILGYLLTFWADLWGIYKRKRWIFHRIFHIFHNGRGGWIKVERSGGKWRGYKGITIWVGGYKNLDIG